MGGQVFARLAAGFDGELVAINPAASAIAGRPAIRSLAELPDAVDLLIGLLPGAHLVEVIE